MPLVSCYLDSPRQTVDFPRLIDGAQGQYMCGETLLCIFSLFPRCFAVFSHQIQYNWISLFTKMLKTCTCLSVKFAFSLNIAYKCPYLRENLQSTITFTDSKTVNKPVKASTTIPPGSDCISCIFFPLANLAILIISLPLFFNRSLEEGKIGTMKFWDAGFTHIVYL